MHRGKFVVSVKFILLIGGTIASFTLVGKPQSNPGLGTVAAGCFIAFALMDNNDVQETNKE
jgi:hypothetical protein